LVFVKALATPRGIDPGEDGPQLPWLAGEGAVDVDEALNRANNRINELIEGLISLIMRFLAALQQAADRLHHLLGLFLAGLGGRGADDAVAGVFVEQGEGDLVDRGLGG
jgi:hypothetical protein